MYQRDTAPSAGMPPAVQAGNCFLVSKSELPGRHAGCGRRRAFATALVTTILAVLGTAAGGTSSPTKSVLLEASPWYWSESYAEQIVVKKVRVRCTTIHPVTAKDKTCDVTTQRGYVAEYERRKAACLAMDTALCFIKLATPLTSTVLRTCVTSATATPPSPQAALVTVHLIGAVIAFRGSVTGSSWTTRTGGSGWWSGPRVAPHCAGNSRKSAQGEGSNIARTCAIVSVASSATVKIAASPCGRARTTKAITSSPYSCGSIASSASFAWLMCAG